MEAVCADLDTVHSFRKSEFYWTESSELSKYNENLIDTKDNLFNSNCELTIKTEDIKIDPEEICDFDFDPTPIEEDSIIKSENDQHTNIKVESTEDNSTSLSSSSQFLDEDDKKKYFCEFCSQTFDSSRTFVFHLRAHGTKTFTKDALAIALRNNGLDAFFCDFCDNFFIDGNYYNEHVRIHIGPNFACPKCNKVSTNALAFKRHLTIHDKKDKTMCLKCLRSFDNDKLDAHTKNNHSRLIVPRSCKICPKKFWTVYEFSQHLKSHSNLEQYICDICNKRCTYKSELMEHIRTHGGMPKYHCRDCGKSFNRNYCLTKHLRIKCYTKEKLIYKCQHCDQVFSKVVDLKKHSQIHKKSKKAKKDSLKIQSLRNIGLTPTFAIRGVRPCPSCDQNFESSSALYKHLKMHPENTCIQCDKSFVLREKLFEHLSVHKGCFECDICCKLFKNKDSIRKHMSAHDKRYKCSECTNRYGSHKELRNHMLRHSGIKLFGCHVCQIAFYTQRSLDYHLKFSHNIGEKVICNLCGKKFSRPADLKRHTKNHFKSACACDECGRVFETKFKVTTHLQIHEKERLSGSQLLFSCYECGKKYESTRKLKFHVESHLNRSYKLFGSGAHDQEVEIENGREMDKVVYRKQVKEFIRKSGELFECSQCSRTFTRKCHLGRHLLTHNIPPTVEIGYEATPTSPENHSINQAPLCEQPPTIFECSLCDKQFNRRGLFDEHQLLHKDENIFSCPKCLRNFSRKCHLAHHLLSHTEGELFDCPKCGNAFTSKAYLKTHMLTHPDLFSLQCTICEKCFIDESELSQHMSTHDQQSFSCHICPRVFLRKCHLGRHLISHNIPE